MSPTSKAKPTRRGAKVNSSSSNRNLTAMVEGGNALLAELQARESEIRAWFAADPSRVQRMQTDPKTTLAEVSKAIGITLAINPALERLPFIVVSNPLECACEPAGSALLGAVWSFIGASTANLAAWNADPFTVINNVATSTKASASDTLLVTQAFEQVLGTTPMAYNLSGIQALAGKIRRTRLGIQPV